MKHRIMIWLLALILAVFISVPALAVEDDGSTTYTDEDGNTITVEVGDHDSNSGGSIVVLPGPDSGTQGGGQTGSGQTGNGQTGSGQSGNGQTSGGQSGGTQSGSDSDSAVIDLSEDPQDGADAQDGAAAPAGENGAAQTQDGAAAADQAKAKSASDGKLPAGTAYALIAILAVILIAGIVYLVRSRKKK